MEPRSLSCELEDESEQRTPPSQRLLTAILVRAIRDFVNYRQAKAGTEEHKIAVDAAGWLFFDGEEFLTYRWTCRVLGGDPVQTRRVILKLKPKDLTKMTPAENEPDENEED